MNWSDIGDAMFGGLADYGAILALVIAIIAERTTYILTRYRVNSREFMAQIRKLVQAGNIDRAIKVCDSAPLPLLQVVKSGLTQVNTFKVGLTQCRFF